MYSILNSYPASYWVLIKELKTWPWEGRCYYLVALSLLSFLHGDYNDAYFDVASVIFFIFYLFSCIEFFLIRRSLDDLRLPTSTSHIRS